MNKIMKSYIDEILKKAHFNTEDNILENAHLILKDMSAGLSKKTDSSLAMLHSKIGRSLVGVSRWQSDGEKVIALDLGGSNLRVALISLEKKRIVIDERREQKCRKEYDNSNAFFAFIAKNMEYLKGRATKIIFCFSYALEFLERGKALVVGLSKDLSIPDIKNKNVGEELIKALKEEGWSGVESVLVTNDTVATFFAGLYQNLQHKGSYNSLMSIILGTGLNAAYFDKDEDDLIILEAGAFDKIKMSDFDAKVIMSSKESTHHILEKQCSAHYLGAIASEMFKLLISKGFFSEKSKLFIEKHWDVFGNWVVLNESISNSDSVMWKKLGLMLKIEECNLISYIVRQLILRTAHLISALIVAIAMKIKNGNNINFFAMIEGSTILKTHGMLDLVKQDVANSLKMAGEGKIKFMTCEHATLVGSAMLARLDLT